MKRYEKEKVGNVFLVDIVAFVHQVAFIHCVKAFHTKSRRGEGSCENQSHENPTGNEGLKKWQEAHRLWANV